MRTAGIILLCIVLVACDKKTGVEDLKSFAENAYKDHIPEVEPLPPLRPTAVFMYTASDQADPFNRSNLRIQKAENEGAGAGEGEKGPDLTRRKEPLEAFPIEALKLVGIIEQNGISWAIVNAPDKTVHRVTEGNYMGKNHGEIVSVADNRLDVVELVRNPVGKWEKQNFDLKLLE